MIFQISKKLAFLVTLAFFLLATPSLLLGKKGIIVINKSDFDVVIFADSIEVDDLDKKIVKTWKLGPYSPQSSQIDNGLDNYFFGNYVIGYEGETTAYVILKDKDGKESPRNAGKIKLDSVQYHGTKMIFSKNEINILVSVDHKGNSEFISGTAGNPPVLMVFPLYTITIVSTALGSNFEKIVNYFKDNAVL